MADYTITLDANGNANPDPQPCHVNDTLTWSNQSGEDQSVDLPACVNPQDGPIALANGQSSNKHTVFEKGHYGYHHHKKGQLHNGPNGTINVS